MNAKEGPHNTNMHIALIFRNPTKTSPLYTSNPS